MLYWPNGSVVWQQDQAGSHELVDPEAASTGCWFLWSDRAWQASIIHDRQGTTGLKTAHTLSSPPLSSPLNLPSTYPLLSRLTSPLFSPLRPFSLSPCPIWPHPLSHLTSPYFSHLSFILFNHSLPLRFTITFLFPVSPIFSHLTSLLSSFETSPFFPPTPI